MDQAFVGTFGKIASFRLQGDPLQLEEERLWTQELKGAGYHMISMYFNGAVLFAATNGHVYSIDPLNGDIRWERTPSHQKGLFQSDLVFLTIFLTQKVCLAYYSPEHLVFVAGSGWTVCLDGKSGDQVIPCRQCNLPIDLGI